MTALNRMRILWGGNNIAGPGVTTFFFVGSMVGIPAKVVTLFTSHAGMLAPGGSLTVPSSGDVLNLEDGTLTGGWTASGGGIVPAAGTGNWSAGNGAVVDLFTDSVFRNRKVRGRYFLVPVTTAQADSNGTIANATVTSQNTALTTFLAGVGTQWQVYSKPHSKAANDGGIHAVTSAVMADRATQLRSRRV